MTASSATRLNIQTFVQILRVKLGSKAAALIRLQFGRRAVTSQLYGNMTFSSRATVETSTHCRQSRGGGDGERERWEGGGETSAASQLKHSQLIPTHTGSDIHSYLSSPPRRALSLWLPRKQAESTKAPVN